MKTTLQVWSAIAASVLVLFGGAACSVFSPPPVCGQDIERSQERCLPAKTHLELADYSGSARNTDLLQLAEAHAGTSLQSMPVGDHLVVEAFNARPGAACTPLEVSLVKQSSSQANQDLRAKVLASFPDAYKDYLSCLKPAGASEIFGAIVQGHADYPEADAPQIISDGCNTREGPKTCDPKQLMDSEFPKRVVNELTEHWPELCRPLQAVTVITFAGVGRGTELNASQLAGLRNVWAVWASDCAHTTIKFN
jgi:hypothetical protein